MKNNLKLTIGIILVVLLGIIIYYKTNNTFVTSTTPVATEEDMVKGCYVAALGQDLYTLNMISQTGEDVEGTLSFNNYEKDSSNGTFKGTYKDGILLGDYTFDSEGMHSVLQVIFKKTPDGFVRGFGDMNSTGTRFADLSNIKYDTTYTFKPAENCATSSALNTATWKTFKDIA